MQIDKHKQIQKSMFTNLTTRAQKKCGKYRDNNHIQKQPNTETMQAAQTVNSQGSVQEDSKK